MVSRAVPRAELWDAVCRGPTATAEAKKCSNQRGALKPMLQRIFHQAPIGYDSSKYEKARQQLLSIRVPLTCGSLWKRAGDRAPPLTKMVDCQWLATRLAAGRLQFTPHELETAGVGGGALTGLSCVHSAGAYYVPVKDVPATECAWWIPTRDYKSGHLNLSLWLAERAVAEISEVSVIYLLPICCPVAPYAGRATPQQTETRVLLRSFFFNSFSTFGMARRSK